MIHDSSKLCDHQSKCHMTRLTLNRMRFTSNDNILFINIRNYIYIYIYIAVHAFASHE